MAVMFAWMRPQALSMQPATFIDNSWGYSGIIGGAVCSLCGFYPEIATNTRAVTVFSSDFYNVLQSKLLVASV